MTEVMTEWFLEIWTSDDGANKESRSPKKIMRFDKPEEAWAYVVEQETKYYCIYKAECVVDAT